ncbi:unnamed protein product [Notodromas monacha]|uniref:Uncharacterized protein n=1 Tax=Notodromas monacha TaxID=399045 RepID=A0A7R9GA17_9CRUS|nr:unnamed protein product [Notodromas monacha]CAG0914843.1 unnamed protein product [Notodromas monacha]
MKISWHHERQPHHDNLIRRVRTKLGTLRDECLQYFLLRYVERGFVVYSAMLSLGACLGTLTTAVDWTAFAVACGVDVSTLIFCLLFACSALCLVVTLAAAQEVPLRSKDRERERERAVDVARRWAVSGVCAVCRIPVMVGRALMHRARRGGVLGLALCLLAGLLTLLLEVVRWPFQFVKMYRSSPEALRRLFLADLASWTCLMGHGIFYTDFVAQAIYKGAPDADVGSEEASGYDEGARMGSWGLCFFSIVGFMYSTFAQEWIVGKVGEFTLMYPTNC